jgi:hypothetical protein
VILGRVPNWPGGLPNPVAAYYWRTGHLLPERTSLIVEKENEPMRRFSEALGVEYISARQVFCNEAGCLDRIGDELMTGDAFHLAPPGSKYLIDQIAPASARCSSTETRRSRRRARLWPGSAGAVNEMTFPSRLATVSAVRDFPRINPLPSSDRTEDNHRVRL